MLPTNFILNQRNSIKHKTQEHIYIGLSRYESWEEESYNYYFPSIQVASFDDITFGIEKNVLPGSK
ncbi:hypothetical protein [Paenibacillus glacialis]|uniref:hypothetical protein n=1 Tax=Paenibacillus glacialis TaxID=494026 RepID=UPI001372DA23|nr:hypothetical protein [Paenibacillus glacialis]